MQFQDMFLLGGFINVIKQQPVFGKAIIGHWAARWGERRTLAMREDSGDEGGLRSMGVSLQESQSCAGHSLWTLHLQNAAGLASVLQTDSQTHGGLCNRPRPRPRPQEAHKRPASALLVLCPCLLDIPCPGCIRILLLAVGRRVVQTVWGLSWHHAPARVLSRILGPGLSETCNCL